MTIDNGISFEEEVKLRMDVAVVQDQVSHMRQSLRELNRDMQRNSEEVKELGRALETHMHKEEVDRQRLEEKLDMRFSKFDADREAFDHRLSNHFKKIDEDRDAIEKRQTQLTWIVVLLASVGSTAGNQALPVILKLLGIG